MASQKRPWKISIDTGGTFTDCLGVSPENELKRLKVLSSSVLRLKIIHAKDSCIQIFLPFNVTRDFLSGFTVHIDGKEYTMVSFDITASVATLNKSIVKIKSFVAEITTNEEVPVFAIRLLTETSLHNAFPTIELRLGSTRGTNALLERKGARTALLVTKGFKDILVIGNQQRPDLFSLQVIKDPPLYDIVIEVNERISARGEITKGISKDELVRIKKKLLSKKISSVAISLLNSYKNPTHELQIFDELKSIRSLFISCSHKLSSQIKFLPRTETTVVNAYIYPIIYSYISRISTGLNRKNFLVMSSAGGLLPSSNFLPKDSLLSGPAGGVIGGLAKARQSGVNKIITFDMGGTSTDVSMCNQRPDYRFESTVGTLSILTPSLAIETIAAGGGSICKYEGGRLSVGPESAGASPGPACYGAGGPLTITDVNLFLGRLDEGNFSIPIHNEDALKKIKALVKRSKDKTESILESLLAIANEKMAEAIRKVSIKKGLDPRDFSLLCFGGAGGQHACAIATILGIEKIIVPYDAGLLSAYGIGQSSVTRINEKLLLTPLDSMTPSLQETIDLLHRKNIKEFQGDGFTNHDITLTSALIFLRLQGQETSLEIDITNGKDAKSEFVKQYKKIYSTSIPERTIEVESIRVISTIVHKEDSPPPTTDSKMYRAFKFKNIYTGKNWELCGIYRWEDLSPGAKITGPSLLISDNATLYIEPGWKFKLDKNQNGILSFLKQKRTKRKYSHEANLELYVNRFSSIAQDMGAMLQRTSFSVNVKERLDFSCAVLDTHGNLIVNAPHIPVHLGSLGVCVRSVMKSIPLQSGDVIITNHPAFGGSHLPDITLIKPVFYKKKRIGFVANRAHHAEVGGKQPGSMPADATCLDEEGIIIAPAYLIKNGKARWKEIETVFKSGRYPSRSVHENLADLNGAVASLTVGENSLVALCQQFGAKEVSHFMRSIYDHAANKFKVKLNSIVQKKFSAIEVLDDGALLKVSIINKRGVLSIDFSGSSQEHSGNLNATIAIVHSVVLYILRVLVDKPTPLNEGLLKHVEIKIPKGILNPKFYNDNTKSPAVVGGNTEISQRLTDTLLKAFKVVACSQGTMNNLIFGNEHFGFYETIGGGTGAGPTFNGADGVHHHMTNTRITDPEIMEHRYPVSIEKFSLRKNTGGKGKYNGGNGIERVLCFHVNLDLNILSQHRIVAPYGVNGGTNGARGMQYILSATGKRKKLKGLDGITVHPGDRLIIKTPGGGGWGKAH